LRLSSLLESIRVVKAFITSCMMVWK
jgi:hypothetical protein